MKTLESLQKYLPATGRVVVARELTKLHEEVVTGTAEYVFDYFCAYPDHVRGEFVVLVQN